MKKRIITIVVFIILLLVAPLTAVITGFCMPAQFDETYYGELKYMYRRLRAAKGKKIVLIGNSSVAFGVRTDLLGEEFPDYEVVGFGLYGSVGTKAMLDLSKANISQGDIVIVISERNERSQSLYFSAENTWYAADGNFAILSRVASENRAAMIGNFAKFTSAKYGYLKKGKPAVSGVYSQSSFNNADGDEVGFMTYNRECNIMPSGYDANNTVSFKGGVSDEFISYLNDYNAYVNSKGATMYFGFSPVNYSGLEDGTDGDVFNGYYQYLNSALNCRIIGNPSEYAFEPGWFYDTNFHLNSAGMYLYTDRLADDLKAELGISAPNKICIPPVPELPPAEIYDGDNADGDGDLFVYEDFSDGVKITGLTEEGKVKSALTIPSSFEGKHVICFDKEVFAGNTRITQIKIQNNIQVLYDNSFDGCTRLTRLEILNQNPNALGVGLSLADGAPLLKIYVRSADYDMFATHYNWGAYRNILRSL